MSDLFRQSGKPILCHECFWEGNYYQRDAGLDDDNMRKGIWMAALSGWQITYADEVVPPRRWQRFEDVNVTFSELGVATKPLGHIYSVMRILGHFCRQMPFWRLKPMPQLAPGCACLGEEGRFFVLYLPAGQAKLHLPNVHGALEGRWFNPRTGREGPNVRLPSGGDIFISAPTPSDWVVTLRVRS